MPEQIIEFRLSDTGREALTAFAQHTHNRLKSATGELEGQSALMRTAAANLADMPLSETLRKFSPDASTGNTLYPSFGSDTKGLMVKSNTIRSLAAKSDAAIYILAADKAGALDLNQARYLALAIDEILYWPRTGPVERTFAQASPVRLEMERMQKILKDDHGIVFETVREENPRLGR